MMPLDNFSPTKTGALEILLPTTVLHSRTVGELDFVGATVVVVVGATVVVVVEATVVVVEATVVVVLEAGVTVTVREFVESPTALTAFKRIVVSTPLVSPGIISGLVALAGFNAMYVAPPSMEYL